MNIALAALGCAALGLLVGLALNVVIDRVPARVRLLPLRFRCPHLDRVPVDGGNDGGQPDTAEGGDDTVVDERPGVPAPWSRCPVCGRRLPPRYALVPLGTAVLYAAGAVRFGADWVLPAYFVFFAALVAISVIDLQLQIIPNRIVYPAIFASAPLLALAAVVLHDGSDLVRALLGAAAAWGTLLVIHLISPASMGFGDVRLSFLLGLFLGWLSWAHVAVGLFFGFLLGALVGGLLVLTRLRRRTDHLPFGPFLAAGAVAGVLFGSPVTDAWLRVS